MDKNIRNALIIVAIVIVGLLALPLVFAAFGGGQGYGYGMMGPWMMGGLGWWWFMPFMMIAFWGLVIWGIVVLVRGISRNGTGSGTTPDSALEILKKRYARGEISQQEYEERKKDLI